MGVKAVKQIVENCARRNVQVLTLFAFSSENWKRPKEEVSMLMSRFLQALDDEVADLHKNGIRLTFAGNLQQLSPALRERMEAARVLTAGNSKMTLVIAIAYGGRWDLASAARRLAERVVAGELRAEDIDEKLLGHWMCLADLPPLDLFIRTGGECRVSNFLLWQLAYAELHFTDTLWPDFDEACLKSAIDDYARRERRFGKTGDQVAKQA